MLRVRTETKSAIRLLLVSCIGALFLSAGGCGSKTDYTLTVLSAGPGTGTVSSSPSGISCPSTCIASFSSGTSVTLGATPGSESVFGGWSQGGCAGTSACVVALNSNTSVTATFTLSTGLLDVEISPSGSGTVTSTDGQINCPGTCSAT
jgi:hypothetical protein